MGQANNFQCPSLSLIHLAKKRAEIFVHRYAAVIMSELTYIYVSYKTSTYESTHHKTPNT